MTTQNLEVCEGLTECPKGKQLAKDTIVQKIQEVLSGSSDEPPRKRRNEPVRLVMLDDLGRPIQSGPAKRPPSSVPATKRSNAPTHQGCTKKCVQCESLNHVRRNTCTGCQSSFPKRVPKPVVLNKQASSKTRENMLHYASQLHLKGYDVVIFSRKQGQKVGSTQLWGTEGVGKSFLATEVCSLAAKDFSSLSSLEPSNIITTQPSFTSSSTFTQSTITDNITQPISTTSKPPLWQLTP